MYAPGEGACRGACVVEGSFVCCLLQQTFGVVARCLCFGQCGGERLRGRVGEDLVGVRRGGQADEPDVLVRKILGRSALAEDQEGRGCRVVVGGLEVEEALVGCGHLLLVLSSVVPACGGDDGEERGVEEYRQGGSVLRCRLAKHRLDRAA